MRKVGRFVWGVWIMTDDIYDFGSIYAQEYIEKCECGEEINISTQQDNSPEYIISVYVRCKCGKSVKFKLPVN